MKRVSLKLLFALVTFFLGVYISTFGILNQTTSEVENPKNVIRCQFPGDFPEYADNRTSLQKRQELMTGIPANFWEVSIETLPSCISEIYRFVLVPSETHSPIAIRVWQEGNKRWLVAKKLHEWHHPTYIATNSVTEEQWNRFKSLLEQSSFWEMPKFNKDESISVGQTKWIMEGLNNKKYHNVQFLAPSNEFREACKYLLKLSNSKLENEYKAY